MKPNSTRSDTDFLRFVAIVLIVNSHLDAYYPLPMLATGGMLGNSLFFMLSAFGLTLSWQKRPRPFSEWYGRRIRRIFPSLWVFFLLYVLPVEVARGVHLKFDQELDFLSFFLFPPDLWFIRALLIYYIIVFAMISRGPRMRPYLCVFALVACAAYITAYVWHLDLTTFSVERPPFKLLFYLLVVLFGIELAARSRRIGYAGVRDIVAFAMCVVLIFSHKLLISRGITLQLQCFQQILMFPMLYYSLRVARSGPIVKHLMSHPVFGRIVRYISGLTLEIYVTHGFIKEYIVAWPIHFPVNVAVLVVSTIMLAALVKRLGSVIAKNVLTEEIRYASLQT